MHLSGRIFSLYISELREIVFLVSCFTFTDNLYGALCIEKSIYFTGSRFFEVFIVFPVVRCLFFPVTSELCISRDMIHPLIIGEYADHFIIHLSSIIELHKTDDAYFDE